MGLKTLVGDSWMLGGVGVAGVEAGVAMTRTTLAAEAALTAMEGVAQVLLPLHILGTVTALYQALFCVCLPVRIISSLTVCTPSVSCVMLFA